MVAKATLNYANIVFMISSIVLIGLIIYRKAARAFGFLIALLSVRFAMSAVTLAMLFHRKELGFSKQAAYDTFFYSHWATAILELCLQFLIIYSVYRVAMRPMEGLQQIGRIVFRWATVVSIALSLMVALGPHDSASTYFSTLVAQAQQGMSVLTICLLVFVCFAARPLGLTFRSRHFGTLLGLGLLSTSGLVIAAWFPTTSALSLYAPEYAVAAVVSLIAVCTWAVYFALPEPARKLVTLPTTSPYFHWNAISKAMGSEPGEVAVAGFTPRMLAPAELTAIAAAQQMAQQQRQISRAPGRSLAEPMAVGAR